MVSDPPVSTSGVSLHSTAILVCDGEHVQSLDLDSHG